MTFLLVVFLGVAMNIYEDSTGFSGSVGCPYKYTTWIDVIGVEHWVDEQGEQHVGTRPEYTAARRREFVATMSLNAVIFATSALVCAAAVELAYRLLGLSDPLERAADDPDVLTWIDKVR